MKKRINLAIIGLLAIIAPVVLTVVACDVQETKQESEIVDGLVVDEINKIIYSKKVALDSKADNLKSSITPEFIKAKLVGEIKQDFKNGSFTLSKIIKENGIELIDGDFKVVQTINAKIIYDYENFKDQITNLKINIQSKQNLLKDVFEHFKFEDDKGVTNFLDTNASNSIIEQIENYLGTSLDKLGLTLENRTSNSIELVVAADSTQYKDRIILTWNLKLFEIYGVKPSKANNIWIKKGIKGYFYLEAGTNQIKYFDVVGYLSDSTGQINPAINDYHKFNFKNQNNHEKNFIFKGRKWTNSISEAFNSFDFTKKTRVLIESPEINKVKVFNKKNNTWEGLTKKAEYIFNGLGEISRN